MPERILKIGVAQNRELLFPVLFHRLIVKKSTKFRYWSTPGDDTFVELDPEEWRRKFKVVQQFATNETQQPT